MLYDKNGELILHEEVMHMRKEQNSIKNVVRDLVHDKRTEIIPE